MALWEQFDKEFDLEGIKKDIVEAKTEGSGAEREEVPEGSYEVKVEKMELVTTKKAPARPMVSVWLRIVEGQYENNIIFMNQLVDEGWKINQASDFLRSLGSNLTVEFESYAQFANLILDIHEDIDGRLEYALDYGSTNRGYPTYKITEKFNIE